MIEPWHFLWGANQIYLILGLDAEIRALHDLPQLSSASKKIAVQRAQKRVYKSQRVAKDKETNRRNKIRLAKQAKQDMCYGPGIDQLDSDSSEWYVHLFWTLCAIFCFNTFYLYTLHYWALFTSFKYFWHCIYIKQTSQT